MSKLTYQRIVHDLKDRAKYFIYDIMDLTSDIKNSIIPIDDLKKNISVLKRGREYKGNRIKSKNLEVIIDFKEINRMCLDEFPNWAFHEKKRFEECVVKDKKSGVEYFILDDYSFSDCETNSIMIKSKVYRALIYFDWERIITQMENTVFNEINKYLNNEESNASPELERLFENVDKVKNEFQDHFNEMMKDQSLLADFGGDGYAAIHEEELDEIAEKERFVLNRLIEYLSKNMKSLFFNYSDSVISDLSIDGGVRRYKWEIFNTDDYDISSEDYTCILINDRLMNRVRYFPKDLFEPYIMKNYSFCSKWRNERSITRD